MLPNLRHLRLLLEVVARGSLNAAARSQHCSQPAVTQAIAGLEHWFGATLFERSANGMQPTMAGLHCARRAQRALACLAARANATATQLEALVAVLEKGSIAAAARAQGVTSPSLHRTIRALEDHTGVSLFEDTSYGRRPTRDAERLADATRLAAAEIQQARAELALLNGSGSGATAIATLPLARSMLIPAVVLEFAGRHPDHSIALLDGSYDSLVAALRRGAADLLIGAVREPMPYQDLVQEPLFDDPLAIIVRAGHPLCDCVAPTLQQMAPFPWVAPLPGAPLRRHFEELQSAIMRTTGAGTRELAAPIESNSLVAARALLMNSDRLMLLSVQQIQFEREAGQLAPLPHPFGRVVRGIGLTRRRNWEPTAPQRDLVDTLKRHAAGLSLVWNERAC